jgi:hypothetical protein
MDKLSKVLFSAVALLLVLGMVTGCGPAKPIKIEVEKALIDGNIAKNEGPDDKKSTLAKDASGDIFYLKDSGTITFNFKTSADGQYVIKVYYALPTGYGDKEQNVIVNGVDLGSQKFTVTGEPAAVKAKSILTKLKKGDNTVVISKNWGYTWFDYITIEPLKKK